MALDGWHAGSASDKQLMTEPQASQGEHCVTARPFRNLETTCVQFAVSHRAQKSAYCSCSCRRLLAFKPAAGPTLLAGFRCACESKIWSRGVKRRLIGCALVPAFSVR